MSYPYILKDSFISIMIDGKSYNIDNTHLNFDNIVRAIKNEEWDVIKDLIDITNVINDYGNAFALGRILVDDGIVYYDAIGEDKFPLDNSLTERILRMKEEGFNIEPLMLFLDNLMDNPSNNAVQELYGFLEKGNLPITEDGHFLAYKRVRDDFTDVHSGKFDNSIGNVVSMPRNQVDDRRENTCSTGLHFCSLGYLSSFGGSRIVILKINPRDVVSIPADYNDTKGRCCRYEVVGEHVGDDKTEAFNTIVVSDYDDDYVEHVEHEEDDMTLSSQKYTISPLERSFMFIYNDVANYPTLQKVAEELGISERTVRRRAKAMKENCINLINRSAKRK